MTDRTSRLRSSSRCSQIVILPSSFDGGWLSIFVSTFAGSAIGRQLLTPAPLDEGCARALEAAVRGAGGTGGEEGAGRRAGRAEEGRRARRPRRAHRRSR